MQLVLFSFWLLDIKLLLTVQRNQLLARLLRRRSYLQVILRPILVGVDTGVLIQGKFWAFFFRIDLLYWSIYLLLINRIDLCINWVVNSFEDLGSLWSIGGCWCRGVLELAPIYYFRGGLGEEVGGRAYAGCEYSVHPCPIKIVQVWRGSQPIWKCGVLAALVHCVNLNTWLFGLVAWKFYFSTGQWRALSTSIEEVHPRL